MRLLVSIHKIFMALFFISVMVHAERGEECVDKAFSQLGIDLDMKTDPKLLLDVLSHDMSLGTFWDFSLDIAELLMKPISLRPMLTSIRSGIINRHPAIVDFLCVASSNNLLRAHEHVAQKITRTLHHTLLLDELVKRMSDLKFMINLEQYFVEKKLAVGIHQSWLREYIDVRLLTKSPFQAAKFVTVDKKTIRQYIDFRQKDMLSASDLADKNRGLSLNILEARAADLFASAADNAMAASVLSSTLVEKISVDKQRGIVLQELPLGWASLYHSWNWAFIVRNLTDLEYILPKLLIPEVMNAEPNEYLYKRGIALWATANSTLLRRAKNIPATPVASEMSTLAEIWGRINRSYAQQFAKHNLKQDEAAFLYNHSPGFAWHAFDALRNGGKAVLDAFYAFEN